MASLAKCPIDSGRDDRKTAVAYEQGVSFKPGSEVVRDADGVKSVLRNASLVQDALDAAAMKQLQPDEIPLIFLDGKMHRERRKHITDFFSPRSIKEKFAPLMEKTADILVGELEQTKKLRIDEASWQMAVTLVGELIGVTRGKSRAQMKQTAKRIERFLYRTHMSDLKGWRLAIARGRAALYVMDFLIRDVRPTVKARRKAPQDDVISRLVAENYTEKAILIDAMTLCGAGMQTTREFISLVAWHLLDNDDLRRQFMEGDYDAQMAILEEILRLEPIVSTLYRRAPDDLPEKVANPLAVAGHSYAVSLRHANIDPAAVGECPFALDPARKERQQDQGAFLSFGNGMHRCPGSPLALNETLALMNRLLKVKGLKLASKPQVHWVPHLATFEIRDVLVTCD
ncbi:MAG TPA: cytochrome P450 [Sphingobium sp.]|uniref:cytochrome P450 n=1 Tax=Sphingobium sp. TaxID=1912891 RepID=UPI002ED66A30